MSEHDFPAWLDAAHFLNLLFLVLLARSGIQILASFPRLYLKDDCAPGHEVLKFTRRTVPTDRTHQSLDEEADVSPWLALPGGKGASGGLGVGRHWHLLALLGWIGTGLIYVILLSVTGEWRRLVPTSLSVFPGAVAAANAYLHLQLPAPAAGMPYNPLQQLAYFAVVFLPRAAADRHRSGDVAGGCRPLALVHAPLRQPPERTHNPLRGPRRVLCLRGRPHDNGHCPRPSQGAGQHRARRRSAEPSGGDCGGRCGPGGARGNQRRRQRRGPSQPTHDAGRLGAPIDALQRAASLHLVSRQEYSSSDISPYFWINGYPPPDGRYRELAANGFDGWRLKVAGAIESDLELSLSDLRRMPAATQVTKHNCIQGWTGVAQWTGVPLAEFIARCRVLPAARYAVFYAFDDKAQTQEAAEGFYYETLDLELARAPQSLLAYEFNGKPLPVEHGAPLRLRVESQLGFKMVKWIREIAFVADYRDIGLGYGGWREDHAYYGRVVGI